MKMSHGYVDNSCDLCKQEDGSAIACCFDYSRMEQMHRYYCCTSCVGLNPTEQCFLHKDWLQLNDELKKQLLKEAIHFVWKLAKIKTRDNHQLRMILQSRVIKVLATWVGGQLK